MEGKNYNRSSIKKKTTNKTKEKANNGRARRSGRGKETVKSKEEKER